MCFQINIAFNSKSFYVVAFIESYRSQGSFGTEIFCVKKNCCQLRNFFFKHFLSFWNWSFISTLSYWKNITIFLIFLIPILLIISQSFLQILKLFSVCLNTCGTNDPSCEIGSVQVRFLVLNLDPSSVTTYSALAVTHVSDSILSPKTFWWINPDKCWCVLQPVTQDNQEFHYIEI